MRFPGRLYKGKQGLYLAIYSHYSDICIKAPPSIEKSSKRLAHVKYSEGGKRRGINVFTLQETEIPEIKLNEAIDSIRGNIDEKVDHEQDIQYNLIKGTSHEVIELIRRDISSYCKKKVKNPRAKKDRVEKNCDKIIPVTSLRKINPERILTPGKQDFVPSCSLEANMDFAQGCISGWIPEPEPKESFDGSIFTNFFLDPWGECVYCYAQPKHKSFPKTIYNIDKNRLKEELLGNCRLTVGSDKKLKRPVEILRLGKRTEAASKYTLDNLIMTLETCTETKTRTVLPTKFLEFNPEIAKLLKKTNSVALYSIGFDELEKGACNHGCSNAWRIEQAIKYRQAGVNTVFYLLILAHAPATQENQDLIKKAKKRGIPIQLLPMRFSSKTLTHKVTKVTWHDLKQAPGESLFADIPSDHWGTYERESGTITPRKIHENWLNLIQDNSGTIRMCHHNSKTTWCGTCYLSKGFITETPERTSETFGGRFKKKPKGKRLPFPNKMPKNNIKIKTYHEKAVEVIQKSIGMLEQKIYPFNLPDLFPDAKVPNGIKPGSFEHALFLFYAVSWDSLESSNQAYKRARTLASNLDLSTIPDTDENTLQEKFRELFGKYAEFRINKPVMCISENAKRLAKLGGDPRELKAETIEETRRNIMKFYQYGRQKAALLIKNYVRFGIWDFSKSEIPIKIDRHTSRISIGTGVISFPKKTKIIRYDLPEKPLEKVYSKVISEEGISAIKADDALWAIGAKLCSINKKAYCAGNCPMACSIRPKLNKTSTEYYLEEDMRKQEGDKSLFPLVLK